MTFIVRTIARTADGREIVRPVTVEKATIAVGRDTANDIHLPDLAVEPFHATLTLQPGGRVLAESGSGLPFAVDGTKKTRADIDVQRGVELRFGGHLLKVTSDAGAVTVTVERTDAVSDAAGDKDERTAFALAGLVPGKRGSAWGFFALVLIACLAWPIYSWASWQGANTRDSGFHADTMWSSGPLSQAHRGLESDCQACHDKAFVSVEDAKCATCHKDTHDHADPRRQVNAMAPPDFGKRVGNAFKVAFGKPTEQRCVDCHSEHEGSGPMPATAQVFCTDCHSTMKARLPDTNLADAGDFGTDHPQFRPAVMTDGLTFRRIALDAKPVEHNGLKFPHDVHLSATSGVAKMAQTMRVEQGWGAKLDCKDCHTKTADGVRFQPVDMEQDCQMCHSLGFDRVGGTVRTLRHGDVAQAVADVRALGPRRSVAAPILAGRGRPGDQAPASHGARPLSVDALFTKGGACFDCHVIDRTGDARTAGWRVRPVAQPMRYMMKGWFDHGAHKTENCASCHAADTSKSAGDLLLPSIGTLGDKGGKTCRSCHGGEASAAKVRSTCAMCHSYHMDDAAPWRARREKGQPGFPRTVAARQ